MRNSFAFEAEPFEFDEGFELAHDEFQPEQFLGWFDKPKPKPKPAVAQTGVAAAARPLFQKAAVAAKTGMLPEKVCWIQNVLNTQGERLATDGIYGPLTREAVRRFQSRNSLSVDGIVGPQTEAALIQSALNQIAQASILPVNGIMDARTREEITRFQSRNSLVPDGIVGPKTRAVMVVALGGRCLAPSPTVKRPAPGVQTPSECSCTSELLDQARQQCRNALFANIKACVLGDPIIATKAPHAADQIASQVTARANTLSSAASVLSIVAGIIRVIGVLITAAKIASIAYCIYEQVRFYQECVAKIDTCEQECRAKGLL